LAKSCEVGSPPAAEFPPMIVGVLHFLESLLDLINQDDVKENCAQKASNDST